jgi:hypothetical protein
LVGRWLWGFSRAEGLDRKTGNREQGTGVSCQGTVVRNDPGLKPISSGNEFRGLKAPAPSGSRYHAKPHPSRKGRKEGAPEIPPFRKGAKGWGTRKPTLSQRRERMGHQAPGGDCWEKGVEGFGVWGSSGSFALKRRAQDDKQINAEADSLWE